MSTRIVVGTLLEDAEVTMTPAAEATLPSEHLSDGPGQLGARFGALDANPQILIDFGGNNQIPYIDGSPAEAADVIATDDPFETLDPEFQVNNPWSVVSTPTPATGGPHLQVIGDDTAEGPDHSGNGLSLLLSGGDVAGGAIARVRFTLRAGTLYKMGAWTQKGNDNGGACSVRLYSPGHGTYLTPEGPWSASPTDLVAAGAYDAGATWYGINSGEGVAFRTEGHPGEEITLELQLLLTLGSATQGRFDDIVIAPQVDFMGIFGGHNILQSLAPKWESSDDGSSWTERAVFTVGRHQFHAVLETPIYARFHRLAMTGTPLEKLHAGDLVVGLGQALEREPQEPLQIDYIEAGQVRLESPGGSTGISNRGPYPVRRVSMRFRFASAAEEAAVRAILVDQVRGGAVPVTVLPAADFGELAIYGDLEAPLSMSHSMLGARQPNPARREYYSDATFVVREGAGFEML